MEEYIKQKILFVYRECGICSFPIDCFEILKHYGFIIRTYDEAKLKDPQLYKALRSYSDDAMKYHNYIYYNHHGNIGRIRFSLMHELGHHILGHIGESKRNEDEADYFASNILAPRSLIYTLNCRNAEDVHTTFEISYAAANRAWYDYRHRWLTDAERALRELIFPPEPAQEKVKAPETKTEIKKDRLYQDPTYTPSNEFVERREKALSRIRRQRRKVQKQLKEYEKDMEFIGGFKPDAAFSLAEHQWLYGNNL